MLGFGLHLLFLVLGNWDLLWSCLGWLLKWKCQMKGTCVRIKRIFVSGFPKQCEAENSKSFFARLAGFIICIRCIFTLASRKKFKNISRLLRFDLFKVLLAWYLSHLELHISGKSELHFCELVFVVVLCLRIAGLFILCWAGLIHCVAFLSDSSSCTISSK